MQLPKTLYYFGILLTIFFSGVGAVDAHGLGVVQTQNVGTFTFEFEQELTDPTAGDVLGHSFRLRDSNFQSLVPFEAVLVSYSKKGSSFPLTQAHLAGNPVLEGISSLSFILAEPGDYEVSLSFERQGESVGETKFEFVVGEPAKTEKKTSFNTFLLPGFIGAAVGFLIAKFLRKGERVKSS